MNRENKTLMLAVLLMLASSSAAQEATSKDSTHMEQMQEIVVKGIRAQKDAPFAVTNVQKKELQEHSRSGRELPMLLARTPGIMAWGENGLGTGTTYMRIRGAGDSRINVTLDGVPLNSPEDQSVFWVNMNSYSALLGSVQVQRGVGTSTNGDGAFGGTIALSTAAPSLVPSAEVNFSYGSYNTMNYGVSASTGLLWNQLIIDGAWHQTQTDGFVHGTDGRSGSYYGGITWLPNDHFTLRYKNIGNYEYTGQAWNGVTAGDNDLSLMDGTYGEATGIKTYRDLYTTRSTRHLPTTKTATSPRMPKATTSPIGTSSVTVPTGSAPPTTSNKITTCSRWLGTSISTGALPPRFTTPTATATTMSSDPTTSFPRSLDSTISRREARR